MITEGEIENWPPLYEIFRPFIWMRRLPAPAVFEGGRSSALSHHRVHWMAQPVPGLSIALPVFLPALVTSITALLLSRVHAAQLLAREIDHKRNHQRVNNGKSDCTKCPGGQDATSSSNSCRSVVVKPAGGCTCCLVVAMGITLSWFAEFCGAVVQKQ
jgi:hypothetical protein